LKSSNTSDIVTSFNDIINTILNSTNSSIVTISPNKSITLKSIIRSLKIINLNDYVISNNGSNINLTLIDTNGYLTTIFNSLNITSISTISNKSSLIITTTDSSVIITEPNGYTTSTLSSTTGSSLILYQSSIQRQQIPKSISSSNFTNINIKSLSINGILNYYSKNITTNSTDFNGIITRSFETIHTN
jgi:hypothetical protein